MLAGEKPAPLPTGVLEQIRGREANDGYVAMGLPAGVRPGSAVRLTDGIFADSEGVLERIADDRRVSILLQLLGREVRVFVPAAIVGTI